jgi:putative membrane protein
LERFLLRVLAAAVAVLIASALFRPLLRVESVEAAVVFALVLGILNAVVRPILVLLTLPLTIVTLGLFLLVVNAVVFWLSAHLPGGGGVHVEGFRGAFLGALTVSVVSFLTSRVLDVR